MIGDRLVDDCCDSCADDHVDVTEVSIDGVTFWHCDKCRAPEDEDKL
jgi:hypothetical protein